jgi:hypothetical protein
MPAFGIVDFLRDGVLDSFVIPAKAGIQGWNHTTLGSHWRKTPAFAGMTHPLTIAQSCQLLCTAQSEMLKPLAHEAFHYDAPHSPPTRFGEVPLFSYARRISDQQKRGMWLRQTSDYPLRVPVGERRSGVVRTAAAGFFHSLYVSKHEVGWPKSVQSMSEIMRPLRAAARLDSVRWGNGVGGRTDGPTRWS